jgi:phage regulator Rha-like protein
VPTLSEAKVNNVPAIADNIRLPSSSFSQQFDVVRERASEAEAIVSVVHGLPTTTTPAIAKIFCRPHKNVLASVEKLISSGTIDRLDLKPIYYRDKYGRDQRAYEITERGALIATPFIGGRRAEEGQVLLVDAFLKARKQIKRFRQAPPSPDWHRARIEAKSSRRTETDVVQIFVEYAHEQGSQNAEKYFIAITRAVNRALFSVEPRTGKDNRDNLTQHQLRTLSMADDIVARALREGMEKNLHYKDVYRYVVGRVMQFSTLVGKCDSDQGPLILTQN